MEDRHNPTMKDVANEAGVALATVSKVVNGGNVRSPYKEKVLAAIEKLDYHVNTYAKGLKAGTTNTVVVMIPNTFNPYFGKLVHALNGALEKRNFKTLLYCTDYQSKSEQDYFDMALNHKVDGVIGMIYNPDLRIPEGIPIVSIDRQIAARIPCIASDNFAGGQLAAEKLISLGCRSLAFMRVGSDLSNEPNKRRAGFENGCINKNVKVDECILKDGEDHHRFREFLEAHVAKGKLTLDGIFCVTDVLAYEIRCMLEDMHFRVPEDVQIIGFDGIRRFGDLDYCCSTIVQPVDQIAELAVETLLMKSDIKPPLICLPVSYAYGGTTRDEEH